MKLIEDKIRACGEVLPGDVLKVDCFLNHQIDVPLLQEAGKEFFRRFSDSGVNKILTVEASGIAVACLAAEHFRCEVLFAKKTVGSNAGGDSRYRAACRSYTKGKVYELSVSSRYLTPNDRVLILDDFLAEGNALNALLSLCEQAGASVVGCGVIIEKAYQSGGALIRSRGIRVESLARIASMSEDGALTFSE